MYFKMFCRLCKGTQFLSDLYMDEDTSLLEKTNMCLDFKICRDDGLSSMICKLCKRKVKKFYKFKFNCLQVDAELKLLALSKKFETNSQTQAQISRVTNSSIEECPSAKLKIEFSEDFHFTENLWTEDNTTALNIVCELCGSIYYSKIEYKSHLAFHNGARPFQCKYCPKRFARADSRENHIRKHLGIQSLFICEICGRSSTKKPDLIRHMKIHSDERNHKCSTCGRTFKRSMDLLTHTRTHTGARPFKCANCSKDYTSHSGLRKHKKSGICKNPDLKILV